MFDYWSGSVFLFDGVPYQTESMWVYAEFEYLQQGELINDGYFHIGCENLQTGETIRLRDDDLPGHDRQGLLIRAAQRLTSMEAIAWSIS